VPVLLQIVKSLVSTVSSAAGILPTTARTSRLGLGVVRTWHPEPAFLGFEEHSPLGDADTRLGTSIRRIA
jgi:hypothetical protein